MAKLTKEDVQQLISDKSPKAQIDVLNKVTKQYNTLTDNAGFSAEENKIVEDIFRVLMKNAEVEVRAALAESVAHSADLPKDIALSLAKDIKEVAMPILKHSDVLDDDDLVEVIKNNSDAEMMKTIAQRKTVSEAVSTALVDKQDQEVVDALLGNVNAKVNEGSYDKIIEHMQLSEQIVSAMVEKGNLPVTVTEKLLRKVTGKIRESLDAKYQILFESKELKRDMEKNLELAAMRMLKLRSTEAQIKKIIQELQQSGQLMPYTALAIGDYHMFEVSMSRLARVPLNNVRILLYDQGDLGLLSLYKKARLPESLFECMAVTVRAIHTLESTNIQRFSSYSVRDIVERMTIIAADRAVPHIDFMVALMKNDK